MAYLDFYGRANGYIRINYTETVNKTALTSTITITSVQMCSTNRYQYNFQPFGTITIGGQTISLTNANSVNVGSAYTLVSFTNVPQVSATFSNNGVGGSVGVYVGASAGYNDFNIFCGGASSGNIEITPTTQAISLSTFSTDSASSISITNATSAIALGDTASITISAAKSEYTHTVQYSFDNSAWTTIVTNVPGGSYTWDTDDVASYFTAESEKICYLRCITYKNGSAIGNPSSTSFRIISYGVPEITLLAVSPVNDNETIKSWGDIYVQGYSRVSISTVYSIPSGASLASCRISMNNTLISDGGATSFTTTTPLTTAGTVGITVQIIDSRGNACSTSISINVYPYSRPYAMTAEAIRYSSNVNTEDKENGTNLSAKAAISYSSINGFNKAYVVARYKAAGGAYPTSYTTLTSGAANFKKINSSSISTEQSYTVQFVIYDSLHTLNDSPTTIEITIPTRSVVLHAKDGGEGLAVGGYSENDGFTIWWDTYIKGALVLPEEMYGVAEPTTTNAQIGQVYFQLID